MKRLVRYWFLLFLTLSSNAMDCPDQQEKSVCVITTYQPSTLQEICFQFLSDTFDKSKSNKKLFINSLTTLPTSMLETVSSWFLQGNFSNKQLHSEDKRNYKLSRDHRYACFSLINRIEETRGTFDIYIYRFNIKKRSYRAAHNLRSTTISDVAFSPSGHYYAFAEANSGCIIITIKNISNTYSMRLYKKKWALPRLSFISFYSDKLLTVIYNENVVLLYKIRDAKDHEIEFPYEIRKPLLFHNAYLVYLKPNPSIFDESKQIKPSIEWHNLKTKKNAELGPYDISAELLVSDQTNSLFASTLFESVAQVWHVKKNSIIRKKGMFNHEDRINALTFESKNPFLITAASTSIKIWDLQRKVLLHQLLVQNIRLSNFISLDNKSKELLIQGIQDDDKRAHFYSYTPKNLKLGLLLKKRLLEKKTELNLNS